MSIKGDFISFTYNGVHSTELGIVRTSSSNRYNDLLVPTSQDKTVAVPGGNGTYFFGSYYTQRAITLDIAYDEVTEETLRRMRKVFESDTVHPLIFDDAPYKVYYAKVQNQPILKYIPFLNYDNEFLNGTPRIYKGEGTINFICYDPFAHCPYSYKNYNSWQVGNPVWYKYDNKNEWNLSALLVDDVIYDAWRANDNSFLLYNPGDLETDFKLIIPISATTSSIVISNTSTGESHTLSLIPGMEAKGSDTHICFDSKTNIIYGIEYNENTGYIKSNNIYNEYINSTVWFKIPKSLSNNWKLIVVDYSAPAGQNFNYENLIVDNFILTAGETEKTFVTSGNIITNVLIKDAITNEVVITDIEVVDRLITIKINNIYNHNISVIVTSTQNNPNEPFLQYDYLYY